MKSGSGFVVCLTWNYGGKKGANASKNRSKCADGDKKEANENGCEQSRKARETVLY